MAGYLPGRSPFQVQNNVNDWMGNNIMEPFSKNVIQPAMGAINWASRNAPITQIGKGVGKAYGAASNFFGNARQAQQMALGQYVPPNTQYHMGVSQPSFLPNPMENNNKIIDYAPPGGKRFNDAYARGEVGFEQDFSAEDLRLLEEAGINSDFAMKGVNPMGSGGGGMASPFGMSGTSDLSGFGSGGGGGGFGNINLGQATSATSSGANLGYDVNNMFQVPASLNMETDVAGGNKGILGSIFGGVSDTFKEGGMFEGAMSDGHGGPGWATGAFNLYSGWQGLKNSKEYMGIMKDQLGFQKAATRADFSNQAKQINANWADTVLARRQGEGMSLQDAQTSTDEYMNKNRLQETI